MWHLVIISAIVVVVACKERTTTPKADSFKGQYCMDPRTLRQHEAYSEWADAYSCTRHRCQPGGRSLAIYTVGCKRVEAPESAIECEEVVEDTNMQFPFCCTRLRCLVVVRGEVWTRVLGQPWETLPAAPWSHMYKMKKPPPGDTNFLQASPSKGPVYELQRDEVVANSVTKGRADRSRIIPDDPEYVGKGQAKTSPDLVIALSTDKDTKGGFPRLEEALKQKNDLAKKRRFKKKHLRRKYYSDLKQQANDSEDESVSLVNQHDDNPITPHIYVKAEPEGKESRQRLRLDESEEQATTPFTDLMPEYNDISDGDSNPTDIKDDAKPGDLEDLVDAIGTRMRDIEDVVQKMSEKVKQTAAEELINEPSFRRNKQNFITEQPFVFDNGGTYYSDVSNTVIKPPREPVAALTYMAPVSLQKTANTYTDGHEQQTDIKKKKHHTKKKKAHHKKYFKGKDEEVNPSGSPEIEKTISDY